MLNERTLELARQILTPLLNENIDYQECPPERYNEPCRNCLTGANQRSIYPHQEAVSCQKC